jgi:hypothetical protein
LILAFSFGTIQGSKADLNDFGAYYLKTLLIGKPVKRQAVRDGLHIIAAAMLMEAGERNLKKM